MEGNMTERLRVTLKSGEEVFVHAFYEHPTQNTATNPIAREKIALALAASSMVQSVEKVLVD